MTYISMLRGINVSGQKKIKMDELTKLYESLGFKNVRTYIQSGNVVFYSSEKDVVKLILSIENKIEEIFGFDVKVFIKTTGELSRILENNPFREINENSIYVTFLSGIPVDPNHEKIMAAKNPSEVYAIAGNVIYFNCPTGYGKTKLNNNFFEKILQVTATTRNWNTVNKLFEMGSKKYIK
jgi:uncharacterized protein (DUF1697 family)